MSKQMEGSRLLQSEEDLFRAGSIALDGGRYVRALDLFRRAARSDDVDSMAMVGWMTEQGLGTRRSRTRASR